MTLEKAKLIPLYRNEGSPITFMFNPTELKFSRSVTIEQSRGANTRSGNNKTSFKHPNPYQLTISNIMLDTYENGTGSSVLEPLKPFTDAVVYVQGGNNQGKRPPVYLFAWGDYPYIRCFVKSCNFRLTMFLPTGMPVRAVVDLTLEQIEDRNPRPDQQTPDVGTALRKNNGRSILE